MIIYLENVSPKNHFLTEFKGHNSDNDLWILSLIEFDLYFMIIYLCMKYESNAPMISTDITLKLFFVCTGKVRLYPTHPIKNGTGITNLHVALMLPTKFRFYPPYGSRGDIGGHFWYQNGTI